MSPATGALALFLRKSEADQWAAFPKLLVLAIPCVLLYGLGIGALRLGRPVMWVERRREHMSGGTHGRGSVHKVRIMGTSAGRIERVEIDVLASLSPITSH